MVLSVRRVVGDDHPPHPLFLVGRPRRTIAVPTLSSMKYPNVEALPTQIMISYGDGMGATILVETHSASVEEREGRLGLTVLDFD